MLPLLPVLTDPFSLRPRAERHIVGQAVIPVNQRRIPLLHLDYLHLDYLWKLHPRLVALNGMSGLGRPAVTGL